MYNMIEDVAVIGSVPLTPYGTPSTVEVPNANEPYLEEHDVMLLENHGALAFSDSLLNAYHKMESVEFYAQLLYQSKMLGGPKELSKEDQKKLGAYCHNIIQDMLKEQ